MPENKKRFIDWFSNVFWYHYKWWFLLGVFIVAVIVVITVESMGAINYDFTVVIGQDGDVTQDQMSGILKVIGENVGDLDGNGEVNISFISVNLGDPEPDTSSAASAVENNHSRMMLYMSDSGYVLFLLDEATSDIYCTMDYFEDELSDYGITPDENNPYRVWLGDNEVFKSAGLSLYGHIIDWTTVGKGSQAVVDGAVNSLKAFTG